MEKLPNSPDIRLITIAEIADEITNDRANIAAHDYIKQLYERYENTEVYDTFATAITEFVTQKTDGLLIGNKELAEIFVDVPIYDGFLLGLAATEKQIAIQHGIPSTQSINNISEYVGNTFQFIGEVSARSSDIGRIESFGEFLYDHNLAHPEDPRRHEIVEEDNPFDALIEKLCDELYTLLPSNYGSFDENDQDTRNFQFGFGIARLAYNSYRLDQDRAFAAVMGEF